MTESSPKLDLNDVSVLWQELRRSIAQPDLWLALVRSYATDALPWQAAYAARQAMRFNPALRPTLDSLGVKSWQNPAFGDAALGRMRRPEVGLLQRFCARVVSVPGDWLSWLYLARLHEMNAANEFEPALSPEQLVLADSALQQARALDPVPGESLHWMGVWRLNSGAAAAAVTAFSQLLEIRPVRFGSMMYLGEALLRVGNLVAAEKAFGRASLSTNPDFLMTLAARVFAHNYWQEAISLLDKALQIRPGSVPILLALAKVQSDVYQLSDCKKTLRVLQTVAPDNAEAKLLEAGLAGRMGDAKAHLSILQGAYESGGDPLSRLASSIAMTLLYQDTLSPVEISDRHRHLCAPIESAVQQKTVFTNQRSTQRRLRIACVTGDLHRQHPVNIFMLPVLLRLDHERFDVAVYHTGTMFDEYTQQAKNAADRWAEVGALDDQALQRMIVDDQVDILIDLAGHTATHRLGVFALRAAPVQATFLGYPHSTGLSALDWLIGDATVSPTEHAHLFSEGIAQLPNSVFCWAPVDEYPLPPARPSAAPVVFTSFNNAMKLSPKTLALWAKVLHAVPDAQLLLKAPSLRDDAVRARFTALFAEQGITAERLLFQGPVGLQEMMQAYGEADIALDPTPYNGGTTSLQALWMGVPVVTLEGVFVSSADGTVT
ncbi:MAG: tetratricopeptide repeat protein, partial [Pseudomonadota bacterium]